MQKLSLSLSELVMFGEVEWVNAGEDGGKSGRRGSSSGVEAVCFVFRSAILLLPQSWSAGKGGKTKAKSQEQVLPLREVEVNSADSASSDTRHVWVLILLGQGDRVFHLSNRRQEVKLEFLRAIRKAAAAAESDSHNLRPASFYSSQSDAGYGSNGEQLPHATSVAIPAT